jgi:hypothetical protein
MDSPESAAALWQLGAAFGALAAAVRDRAASSSEGAAALLHLNAAVAVLTTAFAGLDHTYEGRGLLEQDLKVAQTTAVEVRNRLAATGRNIEEVKLKRGEILETLGLIFPAHVVRVIAQAKGPGLPLPLKGIHCVYRIRHIPLLNYFQSGAHTVLVVIFAMVSLGLFFAEVAMAIWDVPLLDAFSFQAPVFVTLVVMTSWVLLTASISRLYGDGRLLDKLDEMVALVDRRINAIVSGAVAAAARAKETIDLYRPGHSELQAARPPTPTAEQVDPPSEPDPTVPAPKTPASKRKTPPKPPGPKAPAAAKRKRRRRKPPARTA